MEKVNLKLNQLDVESFEIDCEQDMKGTVYGNGTSIYPEISCCCTFDPRDFHCIASERYCSEAEPCGMTVSTGCTDIC